MHSTYTIMEESKCNDYAHAKDVTFREIIKRYTEWARQGKYEEHLGETFYRGPKYVADHMSKLFPDVTRRKNLRILDVAAGTGFAGQRLVTLGFENIDALEPSEGMLEVLKPKNVYSRFFMVPLNSDPVPIEDDSYDVLTVVGGMGENHIPCSGLKEMARVVKPEGLVVIMMREAYLVSVEEYKDRLEPLMKDMETAGIWTMLSRNVLPRYSFENNGVLYTFKVL